VQADKDQPRHGVIVKALRPFGTTIFTEINAIASAFDTINLSQGFPDSDGPEEVRAKAADAIMRGPNQYIPSVGIPEMRQAVARKMKRFYGVDVDADEEVTVTSGATEGLCATLLGILEPGDEVILVEKAIVINNPQNPSGKVFTEDELAFIACLCKEHDAYAISDEVYEHLVFDERNILPF
jgi:N-succinyldiaminopimelate aminotransferase